MKKSILETKTYYINKDIKNKLCNDILEINNYKVKDKTYYFKNLFWVCFTIENKILCNIMDYINNNDNILSNQYIDYTNYFFTFNYENKTYQSLEIKKYLEYLNGENEKLEYLLLKDKNNFKNISNNYLLVNDIINYCMLYYGVVSDILAILKNVYGYKQTIINLYKNFKNEILGVDNEK